MEFKSLFPKIKSKREELNYLQAMQAKYQGLLSGFSERGIPIEPIKPKSSALTTIFKALGSWDRGFSSSVNELIKYVKGEKEVTTKNILGSLSIPFRTGSKIFAERGGFGITPETVKKYEDYDWMKFYEEHFPKMKEPFKFAKDIHEMARGKFEGMYEKYPFMKSKGMYLTPLAIPKMIDLIENIGYNLTKSPSALAGLGTSVITDPITWASIGLGVGAKAPLKLAPSIAKSLTKKTGRKVFQETSEAILSPRGLRTLAELSDEAIKLGKYTTTGKKLLTEGLETGLKQTIRQVGKGKFKSLFKLGTEPKTYWEKLVVKEASEEALRRASFKVAESTIGKSLLTRTGMKSFIDIGGIKMFGRTIIPASIFERMGLRKLSGLIRKIPIVERTTKVVKNIFTPKGTAPQDLYDIFRYNMDFATNTQKRALEESVVKMFNELQLDEAARIEVTKYLAQPNRMYGDPINVIVKSDIKDDIVEQIVKQAKNISSDNSNRIAVLTRELAEVKARINGDVLSYANKQKDIFYHGRVVSGDIVLDFKRGRVGFFAPSKKEASEIILNMQPSKRLIKGKKALIGKYEIKIPKEKLATLDDISKVLDDLYSVRGKYNVKKFETFKKDLSKALEKDEVLKVAKRRGDVENLDELLKSFLSAEDAYLTRETIRIPAVRKMLEAKGFKGFLFSEFKEHELILFHPIRDAKFLKKIVGKVSKETGEQIFEEAPLKISMRLINEWISGTGKTAQDLVERAVKLEQVRSIGLARLIKDPIADITNLNSYIDNIVNSVASKKATVKVAPQVKTVPYPKNPLRKVKVPKKKLVETSKERIFRMTREKQFAKWEAWNVKYKTPGTIVRKIKEGGAYVEPKLLRKFEPSVEKEVKKYLEVLEKVNQRPILTGSKLEAAARTRKYFQDLLEKEQAHGIKVGAIKEYLPSIRKIGITKKSMFAKPMQAGPKTPAFAKAKKYRTPIEAAEAGVPTELDIGIIIYRRGAKSINAVARKNFYRESRQFGKLKIGPGEQFTHQRLPIDEIKDLYFPNEYAKFLVKAKDFLADEGTKSFFKYVDNIQGWLKSFLTAPIPGFHMRNAQSNFWQGFLMNGHKYLNPKWHMKAMEILSGSKGTIKFGRRIFSFDDIRNMAKNQGVLSRGWIGLDNPAQIARELKFGLGTKGEKIARRAQIFSREGAPVKYGTEVGRVVENEARLAGFLINLSDTGNSSLSAKLVKQFFFDYGELSNFEKTFGKRFFLFYSWMRKNIPLQIEQLVKQPGKYALIPKAKKYIEHLADIPEGYEEYKPQYMEELYGIATPFKDSQGNMLVYNPNFAWQDLGRVSAKDLYSALTPLIRIPFELVANRDIFFGTDISSYKGETKVAPGYLSPLLVLPEKILNAVGLIKGYDINTNEPLLYMPAKAAYVAKQIPFLASLARSLPQVTQASDKGLFSSLSTLLGVKLMPYEADKAGYYFNKEQIEALEGLTNELKKQKMWPELQTQKKWKGFQYLK